MGQTRIGFGPVLPDHVGLVNHQHNLVIELVSLAMKAIQEALIATRAVWCEGKMRELGPDHFARLTAVKRLTELLAAGRPTPKALEREGQRKTFTLEELENLIESNQATRQNAAIAQNH